MTFGPVAGMRGAPGRRFQFNTAVVDGARAHELWSGLNTHIREWFPAELPRLA